MKPLENEFLDRIGALSPEQRVMLAELLDTGDDSGEESNRDASRLVAYIVPIQRRYGKPTPAGLRAFLREKLPEHMVPTELVLVDELPRLDNGKVDLRALPAPEWTRAEPTDRYVPPRTDIEKAITGIWADVLGTDRVGVHDNFFEIGGDSILSIQVVARANRIGIRLTPDQLFQHQTIAALAEVVGTASTVAAEQGVITGPVPLTPIQHWFFEQPFPERHHWHHALWLEIPSVADEGLLQQSLRELMRHHDALRLRFSRVDSGWVQIHAPPEESVPIDFRDLSGVPEDQLEQRLHEHVGQLSAGTLLDNAWLIRAARFHLGGGRWDRLLIVIHHLVVDPLSWGILVEDLQTLFAQLSRRGPSSLPAKTTSFRDWSEALTARSAIAPRAAERELWLEQEQELPRLPFDTRGTFTEDTEETVTTFLDTEMTRALLAEAPGAYNSNPEEILLTALVQAVGAWSGEERLLVGLERHGREPLAEGMDLSRTVGWFTSFFPVLLDLTGARQAGAAIKAIKEQLRRIPDRGQGYGILRYLRVDPEVAAQLRRLPQPELLFNYSRQAQNASAGDGIPRPLGPPLASRGRTNQRMHLLEVNVFLNGKRLELRWSYSRAIHRRGTIERVARAHLEAVHGLISHCLSPGAGGYTPSDFSSAGLNQEELDRFLDGLFT